jgi:hypothetical protein
MRFATLVKVRAAVMILAAAAALGVWGSQETCYAFHDGSVAGCEACHTMHNSENGLAMVKTGGAPQFFGYNYLLKSSDPSSTCLNCHKGMTAGFQIMSNAVGNVGLPSQMTPGGDFAWLNITTTYITSLGVQGINSGTRHGHNIVAADYGLTPSTALPVAPGGTYPSAMLSCTSCHDPHGGYRVNGGYQFTAPTAGQNIGTVSGSGSYGTRQPTASSSVGVYRLLGGVNYLPASMKNTPLLAFTYPSPFAFAPSTYNRSEAVTDTRVAYGSGMSEWCDNCHGSIHGDSLPTQQPHPTGSTTATFNNIVRTSSLSNLDSQGVSIAVRYNNYISSGNLSGNVATSYTSMVPYEEGLALNQFNYADLATRAVNDGSQTGGPANYGGGNERVMCLTCHRAHASAWPKILRWNAEYGQYLTVQGVYPGVNSSIAEAQNGEYHIGYLQAQVQRSFYDRPANVYAAYQKSLCKKCHNTASDS